MKREWFEGSDSKAMKGSGAGRGDCSLSRLELGFCGRGLGDDVAKAVAEQLQRLESLALTGAYRLTDEGLGAFLAHMPRLEELVLSDCSRLQSDWLARLPRCCPNLR